MRLFYALTFPESETDKLAALAETLRVSLKLPRVVSRATLHLTLRFLGERSPREAQAYAQLLTHLPNAPFTLTTARPGVFPSGNTYTLVLGLSPSDPLFVLEGALSAALAERGDPPDRRFKPHITLARRVSGAQKDALSALPPPDPIELPAGKLILFQSVLAPSGPTYTALEELSLRD